MSFLCKYQQLQKYTVENDRFCSSSGVLKILAEHNQVPPDPCKTENFSLKCVVSSLQSDVCGASVHRVLEMMLSLS